MTAIIEERAAAKINLTLRVLGRRSDGYHELGSLVAFADFGDRLVMRQCEPTALRVTGPFAAAVDGPNLVEAAVRRTLEADPGLSVGSIVLEKNLPVAAGLGGGSADAAAALRAIRRANPEKGASIDWNALAASLGADVPVCLASRPALMRGIGERIQPLDSLPGAAIVLANPGVPLATRDVFRALDAPPLHAPPQGSAPVPAFADIHELCAYLRVCGNDLERPAAALCPAVVHVKSALAAAPGALLARMSGSGPTCFALFARETEAAAAAETLGRDRPDWWVAATRMV